MSINDGGPAFGQVVELRCVRVDPFGGEEWEPALAQGGMSLRDYFAAKAMQGLIGDGALREAANRVCSLAGLAYQQADAMLEARKAGMKAPNAGGNSAGTALSCQSGVAQRSES